MVLLSSALNGVGGNGEKAYQCANCGGLITHSDRIVIINGNSRHFFVNPAGVECDFYTFYSCAGAAVLGEPTLIHSWFPGYGWQMAFCRHCTQHLGWHYEAITTAGRPNEFWGILVSHLVSKQSLTPAGYPS